MAPMVCPRCGRVETDATARFCDRDGTRLEPTPGMGRAHRAARRGATTGMIALLLGLALLGVAVWLLWGSPAEVDMGTVEVGGKQGDGRGTSTPKDPDGLLRECYGEVPALPAMPGGEEARVFERSKRAARVGTEIAVAGTEPLTPKEEQRFANALARQMRKEHGVSPDRALTARVERIVTRLRHHATRYGGKGYEFEVLDSKDINAFMGPGGRGYVFRGLLESLRSDDALAFVLGHEVAHSELRHLDPMLRAVREGAAVGEAVFGDVGREVGEVAGSVVAALMRVTYDQDQEYEADRLGLCLAHLAGFPKDAGVRAMAALGEGEQAPGAGAARILYDIVTTHPPVRDRRAYLERLEGLLKGSRR